MSYTSSPDLTDPRKSIVIAIAWCLAWGEDLTPRSGITPDLLRQMRQAILEKQPPPAETERFVTLAQDLFKEISENHFPKSLEELKSLFGEVWKEPCKIGLVYGGATKIKQYVFEAAKLQDIRGASALLDRINLVDLPAFFHGETSLRFEQCQQARDYCRNVRNWLDRQTPLEHPEDAPSLSQALIPELIVYSTGGNILAFCPTAFLKQLTDAIEKRYTEETLTANSCMVGGRFRLLEFRFGLLKESIEETFWLDQLKTEWKNTPVVRAYFGLDESKEYSEDDLQEAFENRKNFNELVGKLATQFNLRRSGFDEANRPSRRYPPIFETHPYLRRDDSDRSSALFQITDLPSRPWVSEPLARKRRIGEATKQESAEDRRWYTNAGLTWNGEVPDSWVSKFEQFLIRKRLTEIYDPKHQIFKNQQIKSLRDREARSLREISDASNGFVAYIYADGNNMGQYIRDQIKTPEDYRRFSEDIFAATEQSVYSALAQHLRPHCYTPDAQSNRRRTDPVWIHPFEIVTIGGDDVLLIVPASRALEIARTIGEEFEYQLSILEQRYQTSQQYRIEAVHRNWNQSPFCCVKQSKLSMSAGVLITADNTPIYYADKLVSQLLKSAKKRAKELKKNDYLGGTVDFLILKAVTMISSNIEAFRKEGLTLERPGHQLKLYASPYTLHELGGLLETAKALKKSQFPRSQLYQIRSLLKQGKRTTILNYRYFRVRLKQDNQQTLQTKFEAAWCEAFTNNGNLAPWLPDHSSPIRNLVLLIFFETIAEEEFRFRYAILRLLRKYVYETIWRELVELVPFIDEPTDSTLPTSAQNVAEEETAQ